MTTTYSYTISNCYRDNKDIVDEIMVRWTATKTDTDVEYKSHFKSVVVLDPPGSSPIEWKDIDEATLKTWYEKKVKEKATVYSKAKPDGVTDTKTLEEKVKEQLDNLLESKIYEAKNKSTYTANISGLPY